MPRHANSLYSLCGNKPSLSLIFKYILHFVSIEHSRSLRKSDLLAAKANMLTTNHILSSLSTRMQPGGAVVDVRPSLKLRSRALTSHLIDISALPKPASLINQQLQSPMTTGLLPITSKQATVNNTLAASDSLTNKLLTPGKFGNLETPPRSSVVESQNLHMKRLPSSGKSSALLEKHRSLLGVNLTMSMTKSNEKSPLKMTRKNKENATIQQKHVKSRLDVETPESDFQMPRYEMLMTDFDEEFQNEADVFVPQDDNLMRVTRLVDDPQQMKVSLLHIFIHPSPSLSRFPPFLLPSLHSIFLLIACPKTAIFLLINFPNTAVFLLITSKDGHLSFDSFSKDGHLSFDSLSKDGHFSFDNFQRRPSFS